MQFRDACQVKSPSLRRLVCDRLNRHYVVNRVVVELPHDFGLFNQLDGLCARWHVTYDMVIGKLKVNNTSSE